MIRRISLFILFLFFSCKTSSELSQSPDLQVNKVPVITFVQQTLNLGILKRGQTKDVVFKFTNTGNSDLVIELVTSCKCTKLDWPIQPILPGESAKIFVTYDSTDQELGALHKTIDIIANTDPIVVEAFFDVTIVE